MGNPEVGSSSPYNPDDPQMQPESDQHQEQYDYASVSDFGPSEFNSKPENPQENYQSQSSNLPGNVPKNQQKFQPPPQPQSAQYPLQKPPVNPTRPIQPLQYPPQKPQMIPNYSTQPMQYPPQSPQTNPINPTQPAQFPPQSPQTNPNNPIQPGQYPQQNQQANVVHPTQPPPINHSPQANPQPFPPQNGGHSPQPVQFLPASTSHLNGAAYVIPAPRQYESQQTVLAGKGLWSTGLFDCMEDPFNALTTAFFPCLTFGQVAEIVDNGHTTCGTRGLLYGVIAVLIMMPCLLSCTYRTKLRSKYGLVEAPAPDWVTHFLCEWCALCQEYRELRYRGLDPSIGWYGNVARSQQEQSQAVTIPPMNLTMMR